MRFKLVNIGRGNVTRVVDLANPNKLIAEVGKHLGSKGIDINFDETGVGTVYVGGCRPVGKVEPLDEKSLAWAKSNDL